MSRKISLMFFVLVLILFFLPWVTVSCAQSNVVELSGVDFITGKDFGGNSFLTQTANPSDTKLDPEPLVIGVLAVALIGVLMSFRKKTSVFLILLGIAGIGLMLALKYKIDGRVSESGQGMLQGILQIQINYVIGYWSVIIAFGAIAIMNFFKPDVQEPRPEIPPQDKKTIS